MRNFAIFFAGCLALTGCGGSQSAGRSNAASNAAHNARSRAIAHHDQEAAADQGRCDASAANHEVSEYDTSGDDVPDVRKVFLQVGTAPSVRLVLICREADLNGDGVKDVVRYYNDEGSPLREEVDRDFDGQMDEMQFFEAGHVARLEIDTDRNGIVDNKTFFENGKPVRAEVDTAARSTATEWRPNRWEYYENGRVVRVGSDVDGDGRVDRWDRDEELRRQLAAEAEARAAAAATADGGTGDGGDTPDGGTSASE